MSRVGAQPGPRVVLAPSPRPEVEDARALRIDEIRVEVLAPASACDLNATRVQGAFSVQDRLLTAVSDLVPPEGRPS